MVDRGQGQLMNVEGLTQRRIDAHHHFWHYSADEYGWIDGSMAALRRDFLPGDLVQELKSAAIDGVVSVQARQCLEETRWLLELAEAQPEEKRWICGVVGWAPLTSPEFPAVLEELRGHRLLKGLRHVLQAEPDGYMLRSDFNEGIAAVGRAGLVYDVLVMHHMLPQVIEMVDRHPNQIFVLDHMAKPRIAERALEPWGIQMRELAKREHVYCKVSGLVTEARWQTWAATDLRPYVDLGLETFGPQRLLAGSDWPVCTVASSYEHWFATLNGLLSTLTASEKDLILGRVATKVYQLDAAMGSDPKN
jgi:L-fuconolactonase